MSAQSMNPDKSKTTSNAPVIVDSKYLDSLETGIQESKTHDGTSTHEIRVLIGVVREMLKSQPSLKMVPNEKHDRYIPFQA